MKNLQGVLVFVFFLYILSCGVMDVYYWYRDIKEHDSILRAVFWSPVVATFKATHWPYYEFFQEGEDRNDEEPPPAFQDLSRSIEMLNSAHAIMADLRSSQDPQRDISRIRSLLQQSLKTAERIDFSELDEFQPGMGDTVRTHYLEAVRCYLIGFSSGGGSSDINRGDAAMNRFNAWMDSHSMRP